VKTVEKAAAALVRARFLLQEDADRLIAAAKSSDILPQAGAAPATKTADAQR
jgi:hypothetical protein